MKRIARSALIVIGILLVLILTVPLLIPVPPLPGLVPPEQLADPDSEFIEVNGLRLHVKRSGQAARNLDWVTLLTFRGDQICSILTLEDTSAIAAAYRS
jgi:hypothetical protein